MTFSREDYEAKIRQLETEQRGSAARAIVEAQRYVADLAAARGVTTRLREALLSGAADDVRASAIRGASGVLRGDHPTHSEVVEVCAAFLALHEEHNATQKRLAKVLNGIEDVIADAARK